VCRSTGEAASQIKPGGWQSLAWLNFNSNDGRDAPVTAMKGMLRLPALTKQELADCGLNEVDLSQNKLGDWPHLKELDLEGDCFYGMMIDVEDYIDDPLGAINGLINLPDPNTIDGVPVLLDVLKELVETNAGETDYAASFSELIEELYQTIFSVVNLLGIHPDIFLVLPHSLIVITITTIIYIPH
jgi:hypothetical protein